MSLHHDLLEQADLLARVDPQRPKQVNLRRAVSSAYYAIFHLLTSEASALYVAERALAGRIKRTFSHADMKQASMMIIEGKLPKILWEPGRASISSELISVALAFKTLQETRHEADYDLGTRFTRKETIEAIRTTREAFAAWERVRKTDEARIYLACFHLLDRWNKNPR